MLKDQNIGDYVPVKVTAIKTDSEGNFPLEMESLIGSPRNPEHLIGLPTYLASCISLAPSMNKVSEYLEEFCKDCDVECMNNIPVSISWKKGNILAMA